MREEGSSTFSPLGINGHSELDFPNLFYFIGYMPFSLSVCLSPVILYSPGSELQQPGWGDHRWLPQSKDGSLCHPG